MRCWNSHTINSLKKLLFINNLVVQVTMRYAMQIYILAFWLCVFSCPISMETAHGVLELLLVSAQGLKHAHHLGRQRHYVTIQCGEQFRTSKITHGKHRKIWWNEKFRFALSPRECRELAKVTLKIMERDKFAEDSLVGETRVHVGEIIREGSEREFMQMRPSPYNIVLLDGTYRGELKLGLKFLSGVGTASGGVPPRQPYAVYRPFLNITLPCIPWRRIFFFCTRSNRWTAKE